MLTLPALRPERKPVHRLTTAGQAHLATEHYFFT